MIPAASSRGLPDGGSSVGESVACNDSRLCTSSCCLCGNRWEYVLNFIEDLLSLYDYKSGLRTYGIIITPCGPNQFYQPEIMCLTNDDKYEEGGNFYINRFSMGFSGFGHRDKEQEDMIYNNIVKAKL